MPSPRRPAAALTLAALSLLLARCLAGSPSPLAPPELPQRLDDAGPAMRWRCPGGERPVVEAGGALVDELHPPDRSELRLLGMAPGSLVVGCSGTSVTTELRAGAARHVWVTLDGAIWLEGAAPPAVEATHVGCVALDAAGYVTPWPALLVETGAGVAWPAGRRWRTDDGVLRCRPNDAVTAR